MKSLPRTGYWEFFVFVAEPEAPPDNNAAERSLRPVVISRKVSGARAPHQGTDTKMTPGLRLRHLAGARLEHPHRLPTTARCPSTLNCYETTRMGLCWESPEALHSRLGQTPRLGETPS